MKPLLLAILVVLVAACADHSATQYTGAVMNEATPEAEGSLRLTMFTRTDTSFSGVVELGAPARGTGSAYAWFEGPELRIVTVGQESGDTILWTSRLTDARLGGRFEVTGGDRRGQQGTWHARLVSGQPLTPATLRARPPIPLPRATALWPLLVLAGAGFALARWIRRAVRAPGAALATADGGRPSFQLPGPSGIGGWLALFTLGQSLALLLAIARLGQVRNQYASGVRVGTVVGGMQPLVVLETAFAVLVVPIVVVGLVLTARHSPRAPRYWFAYLAATGVYVLVDLLAMPLIHARLVHLTGGNASTKSGGEYVQLRQLAVTLLWTLYWARSERVRATFGAAALDLTTTPAATASAALAAAPAASSAPPPVRDGRWWRRVVLRTVGGAAVAFVALVAYVFWSIRATAYSVPEGTDVRAAVAGRWTWGSDTAGCRHAHTIAFADGGRVMTITSGEIGASDPVTTYDVRSVSRSSIRGAIRGETRTTDDGRPVVWDLVLTGPDEYRWQRTDWWSTPWSYTGKIKRCPTPPAAAAGRPNESPPSASEDAS